MLEIAVTNRNLCKGDYFTQIEKIASCKPYAVLLREKDLNFDKYYALSAEVSHICAAQGVPVIAHTHPVPGIGRLHVPFAAANEALARQFSLSVSVHSAEEAREAEAMGAVFVIAGHIFDTACKPGVSARGLDFLRTVCAAGTIPVFAIGGITEQNAPQCVEAGAAGVCRMSHWMSI